MTDRKYERMYSLSMFITGIATAINGLLNALNADVPRSVHVTLVTIAGISLMFMLYALIRLYQARKKKDQQTPPDGTH